MAWNTLVYSCGHTEEVQLYGKHTGREATAEAASHRLCAACRAEQAKKEAIENGLPVLEGSEKQIGWAAQIREKILENANVAKSRADGLLTRLDAGDHPPATPEKIEASRNELNFNLAALAKLRSIKKASWWIDHRGMAIDMIILALRG